LIIAATEVSALRGVFEGGARDRWAQKCVLKGNFTSAMEALPEVEATGDAMNFRQKLHGKFYFCNVILAASSGKRPKWRYFLGKKLP
jgi:hypothetical protein